MGARRQVVDRLAQGICLVESREFKFGKLLQPRHAVFQDVELADSRTLLRLLPVCGFQIRDDGADGLAERFAAEPGAERIGSVEQRALVKFQIGPFCECGKIRGGLGELIRITKPADGPQGSRRSQEIMRLGFAQFKQGQKTAGGFAQIVEDRQAGQLDRSIHTVDVRQFLGHECEGDPLRDGSGNGQEIIFRVRVRVGLELGKWLRAVHGFILLSVCGGGLVFFTGMQAEARHDQERHDGAFPWVTQFHYSSRVVFALRSKFTGTSTIPLS